MEGRNNSSCVLQYPKHNVGLDILYINLDKSFVRRAFMHNQFNHYGLVNVYRVRALTVQQVQAVFNNKDGDGCHWTTEKIAMQHYAINHTAFRPARPVKRGRLNNVRRTVSYINNNLKHVVMLAMCGRMRNTLLELTVSLSHLNAINYASTKPILTAHNATAENAVDLSDYALVLEDDLHFAFEVNFAQLISLAPKGFAVLQLVTSNDHSVANLWKVFDRHHRLFVKRKIHDDYWCAGAYIINKSKLRNVTSALLHPHPTQPNVYLSQIIAGYDKPVCYPRPCCTSNSTFVPQPPCIKASRGLAADNLIFSLSLDETYMLTIPIMLAASAGNFSTLHQGHVDFHQPAFQRMQRLSHELMQMWPKNPLLQSFINPLCSYERS
ncbi:hypothetical protein EON65_45830 [archaeon]|nr:MAG: hypothetical protein EON65_45830 [archaeon]